MLEAEWWDYETLDELGAEVAGDAKFIIESALDARGQALIALPGALNARTDTRTIAAIYERLAATEIAWKHVTIIPTDDYLVPVTDPLSTAASLAKTFMPKGARVLPIGSENADYKAAGVTADVRLQDLHWPPDLAWLEVGNDGHTAGIFAGNDYDEALNGPKTRRAVGVMPDSLPSEASLPRVTLTRQAILAARALIVTATGSAQKVLLEKAIEDGSSSSTAIGRVLAEAQQAIDIYWCR